MVLGVVIGVALFAFLMKMGKEAMNEMDSTEGKPAQVSEPLQQLLPLHQQQAVEEEERIGIEEEDIDALPSRLPLDLSDHEEETEEGREGGKEGGRGKSFEV